MDTKNLTKEQKIEYANKVWEQYLIKKESTTQLKEKVGTALKEKINGLIKIKTKEGCGCHNLANEMDRGGIEWCNNNREYIIDHLVKNKEMLIEALTNSDSKIQSTIGWAAGFMPDSVFRAGAAYLLDNAIEASKDIKKKIPPKSLEDQKF